MQNESCIHGNPVNYHDVLKTLFMGVLCVTVTLFILWCNCQTGCVVMEMETPCSFVQLQKSEGSRGTKLKCSDFLSSKENRSSRPCGDLLVCFLGEPTVRHFINTPQRSWTPHTVYLFEKTWLKPVSAQRGQVSFLCFDIGSELSKIGITL